MPEPTVALTADLIDAGRSKAGGFGRHQLACIGVPWPPPSGWQRRAAGRAVLRSDYQRFLDLAPGDRPAKPKTPDLFGRHPALDRLRSEPAAGWWALRFDGGVTGNGGAAAAGGWGYHVTDGAGRTLVSAGGPVRCVGVTNNVAEWEALAAGVGWVAARPARPTGLLIEGDSQLVLFVLAGRWKSKADHLTAYRDACRDTLAGLAVSWAARWIPRAENAVCDGLAAAHY